MINTCVVTIRSRRAIFCCVELVVLLYMVYLFCSRHVSVVQYRRHVPFHLYTFPISRGFCATCPPVRRAADEALIVYKHAHVCWKNICAPRKVVKQHVFRTKKVVEAPAQQIALQGTTDEIRNSEHLTSFQEKDNHAHQTPLSPGLEQTKNKDTP